MKISIFGLGYVGTVTAACLARDGFTVMGVDNSPLKVDAVARGESPVSEPGLSELLHNGLSGGLLSATLSAGSAVLATDVSLVCVGTPSRSDGTQDLSAVFAVIEEIGAALRHKAGRHVVVIRSTVAPGTTDACSRRLCQSSGRSAASVVFNPEFLREGTAIRDYDSPPYTVIGTDSHDDAEVVARLYHAVKAPVLVKPARVAEMVKLACNSWHATKIAFANEMGRIGAALDVDAHAVMDVLVQDTKLNVSRMYMRPGFAFGGSCLPKDVRATARLAALHNVQAPLMSSILASNDAHIAWCAARILKESGRRIGMVGLAFKPDTDDLRESSSVTLARILIAEGRELKILDRVVHPDRLVGANLRYMREMLPDIASRMVDSAEVLLAHAEVLVLTHNDGFSRDVAARVNPSLPVIDLSGMQVSQGGCFS